ncbi:MAG: hypothetical protein JSS83_25760 [Cyanobacteria bacterium SZAS LIN-3]|nr:hypothetical protein [Cyanobacteria bacterium SZAS LIN-3]
MKWSKFLALAVTLPLSITVALAQSGSRDADIWSYSQDLEMRIERGHQTGTLNDTQYNSLKGLWNNIENLRRPYDNRTMEGQVRVNMMNSLTNLDKMLTDNLHDNENSHYQQWDSGSRTWHHNWWSKENNLDTSFDTEIDAYQRNIKDRIDRGRATGRISPSELQRLNDAYNTIDRTQQQYRLAGYSTYERNSINSMMAQLDRDVTAALKDDDNSHYRNWNDSSKTWSHNWWQGQNANNNYNNNTQINVVANQNFNAEIDAYQRNLKQRMDDGRISGKLTPVEYNQLSGLFRTLDTSQSTYGSNGFSMAERNAMMNRLTTFDRELTSKLNDNNQAHFGDWNPTTNTWNRDWWKSGPSASNLAASNAIGAEVNTAKLALRSDIDANARTGKLSPRDVSDLNDQYNKIERQQQAFIDGGYNNTERDRMMQAMANLRDSLNAKLNANTRQTYDGRRGKGWGRGNNNGNGWGNH